MLEKGSCMDIDAYVAEHEPGWQRLGELLDRRRLSGPEADELVSLYQRTATHLSVMTSSAPDPTLVGWLSSLVARARSAVTGAPAPAWRDAARFLVVGFPAACYRTRRWSGAVAVLMILLVCVIAAWVAGDPEVRANLASPEEIRRLAGHDFADYYSTGPAGSFGARVWTNNAIVAATCLVSGMLLLPAAWVLLQNAVSLGITAGLMTSAGELGQFLALLTPHGLLELTCVFIAGGAGLRLGWTVIDPGPRVRGEAVAATGRATVGIAVGLALALCVAGALEAFVTPSGLPGWAKIVIGAVVEGLFLTYIYLLGRRAVRAGETGDIKATELADRAPSAG
jgi:uncharacterized membrane protein SpoIIM required for sporulation